MSTMKPIVLLAFGCLAKLIFAGDLTVDVASSIRADAEYDKVTINADCTIEAGVKLTCGKLCVADGNVTPLNLILKSGAQIKVTNATNTDGLDCVIGVNGGQAFVTLEDGASLTGAKYLSLGYISDSAHAMGVVSVVLKGSARIACAGDGNFYLNRGKTPSSYSSTTSYVTVRLEGTSALEIPKSFSKNGVTQATIQFAGGSIDFSGTASAINDNQLGRLVLESVDGADVVINTTKDCTAMFANANNAFLELSGTGSLVKGGSGSCALYATKYTDRVTLGQAGGLVVREGELKLDDTGYSKTILEKSAQDLSIYPGAAFDVNGQSLMFDGVVCGDASSLKNSGSAAPCLSVGNAGGDSLFHVAPSGMSLEKNGAGKLTLVEGAASSVTVNAGKLVLGARSEVGYPYYRMHIISAGNNGSYSNMRFSELFLYDGDKDVTASHLKCFYDWTGTTLYGHATNLWDRNFSTNWDDRRLTNTDWRRDAVYFSLLYYPSQPLTSYTWAQADKGKTTGPCEWYMKGSVDGETWTVIDHVENFQKTTDEQGALVGTIFDFDYPVSTLSIGNLKLGSEAQIEARESELALSALEIDCLATGSISGLTPGVTGTLSVNNAPARWTYLDLPIALSDVRNSENFKNWHVVVNGKLIEKAPISVSKGVLRIGKPGLILIFR